MTAVLESKNAEEFKKNVEKLSNKSLELLANELPKKRTLDSKNFYSITKAFIKTDKEVKIVKAFTSGNKFLTLQEGTM